MITFKLITLLFTGLIFTAIGFFLFKTRKVFGAFVFIVGLLVICMRFGPLSNSKEKLDAITYIDSLQVVSIKLYATNFKNQPIAEISDRKLINRLCTELLKSTETDIQSIKMLHHKWTVVIDLKSKQKILFSVKMGDYVTGLSVNSNGDSGWQYGYLRADSFGEELEKIVEPLTP